MINDPPSSVCPHSRVLIRVPEASQLLSIKTMLTFHGAQQHSPRVPQNIVNLNRMRLSVMELSHCLFCSEHCSPQKEKEGIPFNLLGCQLKAVFVLRELLLLPPEKLTEFLESSAGDHLHEWIRFCDLCQALVGEAFSLFEEQVKIHRKFKKVQEKVLKKVKNSMRERGHGSRDAVAELTRDFVKNHDYGPFESRFLAGDWEAEWQLELRRTAAVRTADVKEEVDDDAEEFAGGEDDATESLAGSPRPVDAQVTDGEQAPEITSSSHRYPCPLCPLSYPNKHWRWRHVQQRHKDQTHMLKYVENEQPMCCPTCQKVCKGRKGLLVHQKTHQNLPRKRKAQGGECPTCHTVFATSAGLRLHKNCKPEVNEDGSIVVRVARKGPPPKVTVLESETFTKNGRTLFRCGVTSCARKVFKSRESFLKHKKNHDKPKPKSSPPEDQWLTCDLCQDKFLRNRGLLMHRRLQHPEHPPPPKKPKISRPPLDPPLEGEKRWRRFVRPCPQCPYTGTRPNLEAHVKRVHEGGQYPLHCELCAKGVATPNVLKMHQAEKHFICGVTGCGVKMESPDGLHAHQVDAHGREVHVFKCDDCGKLWPTKRKRERHQRQVHQPKNAEQHICEQCGKTFAFREYLLNHVWHAHKKLRKSKPKKESITE